MPNPESQSLEPTKAPVTPGPSAETLKPPVEGKETAGPFTVRQLIEQEIATLDDKPALSAREKWVAQRVFRMETKHGIQSLDTQIKTQQELDALKAEIKKTVDQYRDDKFISRREVRDLSQTVQSVARHADETTETSGQTSENASSVVSQRTDIIDLNDTPEGIKRREGIQKTFKKVAASTPYRDDADKTALEAIKTVDDLRNIPVEQLIKLEDLHEGILLYAFTDFVGGDKKVELTDFESFYKNPTPGQKLRVDFRGNAEAENALGAADIFPPSIRRITVYEGGDKNSSRTSERRVGLKGQNKQGAGFFDGQGYIPVYTGDEVVVGGEPNPEALMTEFNKFRKQVNGVDVLDYEAYEKQHGEKDKTYIQGLRDKGVLHVSKTYTPEEIEALEAQINASGVRKNIVSAALRNLGKVPPKMSCWDWANSVYREAGATFRDVYHHRNYPPKKCKPGQTSPNGGGYFFDDSPENPPMRVLKSIDAGDWIYYHNKNGSDYVNDHSAIFLRWIDKENLIGEVISNPANGNAVRKHSVNFKDKPVTFIQKPVPLGKRKS